MKKYKPEDIYNYTPVLRPMPVPGIGSICDEPLVTVTFSQALVPYLIGLLEIYRWPDRLEGTPEEVQTAVGVFQDLIIALTEGSCFMLRQDPVNPCQLQQKNCSGEWVLAFDFSRCMRGTSITNSITTTNQINEYIDNITNVYNNDFRNIAPAMEYGSPGATDQERNKALCYALRMFVKEICLLAIEYKKQKFEQDQQIPEWVSWALLAAGALLSFFIPPAGGFLLWMALGTTSAGLLLQAWLNSDEADFDAYENEDAIEEVACFMYNNMRDADPTEASFANSLNGEIFVGDAETVADSVAITIGETETYMLVLRYMGDALDMLQIGASMPCPCEGEEEEFDFTTGENEWYAIFLPDASPETDSAVYEAGVGWWHVDYLKQGPTRVRRIAGIWRDLSETRHVDSVTIYFNYTAGTFNLSSPPYRFEFEHSGGTRIAQTNEIGTGEGQSKTISVDVDTNQVGVIFYACSRSNYPADGSITITKVVITYTS